MEKKKSNQTKYIRVVRPYSRRIKNRNVRVKGYKQTYISPRGPKAGLKPDKLIRKSQTIWLMDKYGRFVGRANSRGETTAKNVAMSGVDRTTVVRDEKRIKRIFGRTPSE